MIPVYLVIAVALALATLHTASKTFARAKADEARERRAREAVVEPSRISTDSRLVMSRMAAEGF